MNDTQNGVIHPHDLLVRNVLGDADLAADLFRHYLPPDLASNLDLSGLRREAVESVDSGLSELVGDLRFSGRFTDTGRDLRLFLFLEHQSRPDRFMAFRLLEYVCAAYRNHLRTFGKKGQSTTFPYPLAVVLHHGKRPWRQVTPMSELIDVGAGVPKDILTFPVFLVDLARISGDQLQGHPAVCAVLEILQSASMGSLAERAGGIFGRLRDIRNDRRLKGWLQSLGKYYVNVQGRIQSDVDDLITILHSVLGKREAKTMGLTIADELRLEGRAKGRLEGKAEGRLEGRLEGKAEGKAEA
ncbi:MAG: Rpn family recombination-promoting nuclease/putative transposase, partial [Planctomycetota bacterium]|nr:Rpn family recombination-promoting nuclease/putative transposase [Planctomycetota bacterium]